jgi:hypothetical protein
MSEQKVLSGCGKFTAKILDSNLGVSSQMDLQVQDSEAYFEEGLWSFDHGEGKIHYL